jgi:outer membrane assembly lipoprotein YfgL
MLAACASGSEKPKPAPLQSDPGLFKASLAWSDKLAGKVAFPLQPSVRDDAVVLADASGQVLAYDAPSGAVRWRADLKTPLGAGVGGDGLVFAVVTSANELVVFDAVRERWRQSLGASTHTPPLVAGGRVFVLMADRSVLAFDGQSGREIWKVPRSGESLVLRQMGVLLPVGDTLVVGLSGRLVGLHPSSGSVRWEVPIAAPRGTNEVERLVDLVGPAQRLDGVVCVRSFQAAIGCVDAVAGKLLWSKSAVGGVGLAGDAQLIYAVEGDGQLMALRRSDGTAVWSTNLLRYHDLSAPLVLGRAVLVGDEAGLVHLLSRSDGSLLARLTTDDSAIETPPVLVANTLVVATRLGGVYGFKPE